MNIVENSSNTPQKSYWDHQIKRDFAVYFCVAIGSIFRVLYLWLYPVQPRDAFKYKAFIESWGATGEYPTTYPFPPLGLFLLKAPRYFFVSNTFTGGIIVNMILGLCIIALIMKISFQICPSLLLATGIGLTVSMHPTLVHYSCQMLRENPFLFFCCISILFLIDYLKENHICWIVISSYFAIAACLCRYEALELCIIIGFLVFINPRNSIKKRFQHLFFFILGGIISMFLISYTIGVPLDYLYSALIEEFLTRKV